MRCTYDDKTFLCYARFIAPVVLRTRKSASCIERKSCYRIHHSFRFSRGISDTHEPTPIVPTAPSDDHPVRHDDIATAASDSLGRQCSAIGGTEDKHAVWERSALVRACPKC